MRGKRIKLLVVFLFVFLLIPLLAYAQINRPESVLHLPEENSFLIANVGNGTITEMDLTGVMSQWASGLTGPKGMVAIGDKVYVSDVNEVKCLDRKDGKILWSFPVAGSEFLNDLCYDGKYLYVTDTGTDKINRINPASGEVEDFIVEGLSKPNGLLYDEENNRILLVSFRQNSPIEIINLEDGTLSTLCETELSNLDGIDYDSAGNIYLSSWEAGAVFRFECGGEAVVIAEGFNGPADFCIYKLLNILVLPVMEESRVKMLKLDD